MPDIISEDQIGFLFLRFILHNVLLQHKLIHYAKESQQDMVLLKLDFRKAYNIVELDFLFKVIEKMGVP